MTTHNSLGLWTGCVAFVLGVAIPADAQEAPMWRETLAATVESYDFSALGSVLVQLKTGGPIAIDPETGKRVWSRPNVSEYDLDSRAPFLLQQNVLFAMRFASPN